MLGNVHERRGSVYERLDQRPAALEAYRLSMTVREKLAAAPHANVEARRNLGIAHEKLGLTYQSYGQLRNARIELDSAQRIYAAIAQADPDDANARLTVAIGEMNLGALAWSREIPSERNATLSREHYARAVGALTALAAADPSNQRTKSVLTEAVEALNDR
jgi:tetratricopeptide (TPR) repeat protein